MTTSLSFVRQPANRLYRDAEPLGVGLVFQTPMWLEFLRKTQGIEPVIAEVRDNGMPIGTFAAGIVRRCHARILGSPLPGWTTPFMGFDLTEYVDASSLQQALENFAYRELGCVYYELRDMNVRWLDPTKRSSVSSPGKTLWLDLLSSDDEQMSIMTKSARWGIRKAAKHGVVVEQATDTRFVDEYYDQLTEVFTKQGMRPPYQKERVEVLYETMAPTGDLLCLRANDSQGDCIATGIFLAHGDWMFAWGLASWLHSQHLCPNEAIQFAAMRYWHAQGVRRYDMTGIRDFKRKFGPTEVDIPWYSGSRLPGLLAVRSVAGRIARGRAHNTSDRTGAQKLIARGKAVMGQ